MKTIGGATTAVSSASAFPEADGFITVREVARRSSMSEKTIRNIIRENTLPHYRKNSSGKIWLHWTDFAEWMERQRVELKQDDCLIDILRDLTKKAQS